MVRASHPAQPSPAQPSPAQRESWQQVDSGHGGDSQSANPANQLQSKCQGREMEMNVSNNRGCRLSWVRVCSCLCGSSRVARSPSNCGDQCQVQCSGGTPGSCDIATTPATPLTLPHTLTTWGLVSGILSVNSRSSFHQTKLAHF